MPRARMKVSAPRLTFLSWAIRSISVSSAGRPAGTSAISGRQADRREMADRTSASAMRQRPRRAENSNASAMPIATASPCSSRSEKPAAASKAWPKVWPRLSSVAVAGLALVARARSRPWLAAASRATACSRARPAREHVPPVRLEPGEEVAHRRAGRISRPRHSRRGTRAAAACRAARYRRSPGSADGRRRPGSCRARC